MESIKYIKKHSRINAGVEKPEDGDEAAISLAKKFIDNFKHFADNREGRSLVDAGPQIN